MSAPTSSKHDAATAALPTAEYARYRAPKNSGTMLVVPPGDQLVRQLTLRAPLGTDVLRYDVGGRMLSELRTLARQECLTRARQYTSSYADIPDSKQPTDAPLVVTGHQPGLPHPGVLLKNFAAGELAARSEGVALNLIIDSDLCPAPSTLVPTGNVSEPIQQTIAFDQPAATTPYEQQPVVDESLWQSFDLRVGAAIESLVPEPLLKDWWPTTQTTRGAHWRGLRLAQARHRAELRWTGPTRQTLELPQSEVCQTVAFQWFAAHVLAQLGEFANAYNDSLAAYRRAHRIRNHAHPLPDLRQEGEWQEAPFWIWSNNDPERRALYVRRAGSELHLTDQAGLDSKLPLNESLEDTADAIGHLEQCGIKLRSRALTTTLFARLFLADLFIHGIGGGKYDQVTNRLSAMFFGNAPADFAVVTGTLHLPIEHPQADNQSVRAAKQQLRDLRFHPEVAIDAELVAPSETETFQQLRAKKMKLIHTPSTAGSAAERHQQIGKVNAELLELAAQQKTWLETELAARKLRLRANRVLESREYAFCLYPQDYLKEFLLDFGAQLS